MRARLPVRKAGGIHKGGDGCFHFSKTVFRFLPRGVPKKQKAIFPFFPAFLVQNAVFWRPKTQNTKKQNKRGKNLGAECILHSVFCILI